MRRVLISWVLAVCSGCYSPVDFQPPVGAAGGGQTREGDGPDAGRAVPVASANAAGAKPQAPAATGGTSPVTLSFRDFRFAMTRDQLQKLAKSWELQRAGLELVDGLQAWCGLPKDQYAGIAAFGVEFDDGSGLLVKQNSGRIVLLPSDVLSRQEAGARLVRFALEFPEHKGTPDPIIEACREKFGAAGRRLVSGDSGLTFRIRAGFVESRDTIYGWEDPAKDESCILKIRRYGQTVMHGDLGSFRAVLLFEQGARTRAAIRRVLEEEAQRRQSAGIQGSAESIRRTFAVDSPQAASSDRLSIEQTPLDAAPLHGSWIVRGGRGGMWEGYLVLEKGGTEKELQGRWKWLRGESPRAVNVRGGLYDTGEPGTLRFLILRTMADSPTSSENEGELVVAAVSSDAREIRDGQWGSDGQLPWQATPASSSNAVPSRKPLSGNWRFQEFHAASSEKFEPRSEYLWQLEEKESPIPDFRLIEGTSHPTYQGVGIYRDQGIRGYYDAPHNRLYLRVIEENGQWKSLQGSLTPDDNELQERQFFLDDLGRLDASWRAIRDELIPDRPPQRVLILPDNLDWGSDKQALAIFEGLLDTFEIDVAVEDESGKYTLISRREGNGRKTETIDTLPHGRWFSFNAQDIYGGKVHRDFLARYGQAPTAKRSILVIPESLAEKMRELELAYLREHEPSQEPRKTARTRFKIDYDAKRRVFHLNVLDQNTNAFLHW